MGMGGLVDSVANSFWDLETRYLPRAPNLLADALGHRIPARDVYGCEPAALACR